MVSLKHTSKLITFAAIVILISGICTSCSSKPKEKAGTVLPQVEAVEENPVPTRTPAADIPVSTPTPVPIAIPDSNTDKGSKKEEPAVQRRIFIDPGHQAKPNCEKEPIAPNARITKEKMSYGTTGVVTKVPEYKLNLSVSLKLKEKLQKEGYQVVMSRETNEVNSSNAERAKMANGTKADLVVRIHADGYDNSSVKGVSVLYPDGKYITDKKMLKNCKLAAETVLKGLVASTGAASRGIVARDDMTGFNWSTVPVILVEMGFMTNPEEDRLLNTSEYQNKLVDGIVRGIEDYFSRR